MSSYHQIFLGGPVEEMVIADALAVITGCAPQRQELPDGLHVQRFMFDHSVVDLEMSHDYEDDLGIAFSDYPVMITVRDLNSDKSNEGLAAERLFYALVERCGFNGLLVFDLQEILGRN